MWWNSRYDVSNSNTLVQCVGLSITTPHNQLSQSRGQNFHSREPLADRTALVTLRADTTRHFCDTGSEAF